MSRSYKKHPYYTDGRSPTPRQMKSIANRSVRRRENRIVKGWLEEDDNYEDSFMLEYRLYKKWFCSYDIHDYVSYWSKEEAILNYYTKLCYNWITNEYERLWGEYETEQDFLKHWAKYYRRK